MPPDRRARRGQIRKGFEERRLAAGPPAVLPWLGSLAPGAGHMGRGQSAGGARFDLDVVNWGHDYRHFVGLVRETRVATFAVVAYNFHVQRTWRARIALATPQPRVQRTRTAAIDPTPSVPSTNGATRKRRGPKGLEFLGTPRAGP
jgi:hypothetical protein